MEDVIEWLNKRMQKLRDKKKSEEAKETPDMDEVKRIGAKLAGYKEVLTYINTHNG